LFAATLPGVRAFLLFMTILGGLLALVAAVWVAIRSSRERRLKHDLAREGDRYQDELILHSQKYQAFGNQRDQQERTGEGPVPVPPFGGMDQQAHYDQLFTEHVQRVQTLTGRDPSQPESDQDVRRGVLVEFFWPAVLAGLGVVLSTIASAASLYV
jgi:hypothetical protein